MKQVTDPALLQQLNAGGASEAPAPQPTGGLKPVTDQAILQQLNGAAPLRPNEPHITVTRPANAPLNGAPGPAPGPLAGAAANDPYFGLVPPDQRGAALEAVAQPGAQVIEGAITKASKALQDMGIPLNAQAVQRFMAADQAKYEKDLKSFPTTKTVGNIAGNLAMYMVTSPAFTEGKLGRALVSKFGPLIGKLIGTGMQGAALEGARAKGNPLTEALAGGAGAMAGGLLGSAAGGALTHLGNTKAAGTILKRISELSQRWDANSSDVGKIFQQTLTRRIGISNKLYHSAEAAADKTLPSIDTADLRTELTRLLPYQKKGVQGQIKQAIAMLTPNPLTGQMPYSRLSAARKMLDAATKATASGGQASLATIPMRKATNLIKAEMDKAASTLPAATQQKLAFANKYWSGKVRIANQPLFRAIKEMGRGVDENGIITNFSPKDANDLVEKIATGTDAAAAKELSATLTPEARQEIRNAIFHHAVEKSLNGDKLTIDPQKLRDALSTPGAKVFFGTAQEKQYVDGMVNLLKAGHTKSSLKFLSSHPFLLGGLVLGGGTGIEEGIRTGDYERGVTTAVVGMTTLLALDKLFERQSGRILIAAASHISPDTPKAVAYLAKVFRVGGVAAGGMGGAAGARLASSPLTGPLPLQRSPQQ